MLGWAGDTKRHAGMGVVAWFRKEAGGGKKVCMHACMGNTWVLFGIGWEKRARKG